MQEEDFPGIDTKTPNAARGYDYVLGGTDNYAVDRVATDQAEDMIPGTKVAARNNRRFMERMVRHLAEDCGIRQFIDNGSGLPTQNNVHQIAQGIAPESRVIYIDNDPVVLLHQKVHALAENKNTAFILADARDVDEILDHQETAGLLDLSKPTAVLYVTLLHYIPDTDDPWGMVGRMMSRLAPGSYLAISHAVSDDPEVRARMSEFFVNASKGRFGRIRKRQEVRALFEGLEVVEPGLVNVNHWRPDGREEEEGGQLISFGGVARKPR
jgi:S-adenosyl methyltransferase